MIKNNKLLDLTCYSEKVVSHDIVIKTEIVKFQSCQVYVIYAWKDKDQKNTLKKL